MLGPKKSRVPGRSGNEYGNAAPAEAPAGGRSAAAPQMDSRGNATGVFAAGVEHLSVARTITEKSGAYMCEKEYDCSGERRLSGSRRVQGNRPPSQERTASRSLNNLWVQKSFARAPSSTLDDRERRRSGEHGGAALAFEASWHDAPNATESSDHNAPTLQMID